MRRRLFAWASPTQLNPQEGFKPSACYEYTPLRRPRSPRDRPAEPPESAQVLDGTGGLDGNTATSAPVRPLLASPLGRVLSEEGASMMSAARSRNDNFSTRY